LNWLCDALANPDIQHIRTESDVQIAGAFAALVSAATDPFAPEGCPLTVEQITERLDGWTGGRKFGDVTAEDVQAVIDRHQRDTAVAALINDIHGAMALATEQADHTRESV